MEPPWTNWVSGDQLLGSLSGLFVNFGISGSKQKTGTRYAAGSSTGPFSDLF
jgi:hypothetical protein